MIAYILNNIVSSDEYKHFFFGREVVYKFGRRGYKGCCTGYLGFVGIYNIR